MDLEQFLTDKTQSLIINNTMPQKRNWSTFLGLIMTKSLKDL